MMNEMLISSRVPQNLCEGVILTANYIHKKVPHRKLNSVVLGLRQQ
jgi:hypothetical protein